MVIFHTYVNVYRRVSPGFRDVLVFLVIFQAGMTWITPRWNEEHPKERIRPGDSIVKVGHSWGSWWQRQPGAACDEFPGDSTEQFDIWNYS